jgi:aminopeptidase N
LFFEFDVLNGELVVVHELAHQWFGDDLRVKNWQHIWLNEGFATYTEWLWLEQELDIPLQEIFDFYASTPRTDPGWSIRTGDPGPVGMFDFLAIYLRGAMTLHSLRQAVGDTAFFRIVDQWTATQAGDTVTTDEFIALAEKVSGKQLDALFDKWLFTPRKPAGLPEAPPEPAATTAAASTTTVGAWSDPRRR